MTAQKVNKAQTEFINAMGDLLASWSLSHATGRSYGLLLLSEDPISFDDIAESLGLSKGAVSTAIGQLKAWGLAGVIPQAGSRRLLVKATGGLETLLTASHTRARLLISTLRQGEMLVDGATQERLGDVLGLFEAYVEVGDEMLRQRSNHTATPRP